MKFTKMHGCGNDYVYVDCFKEKVEHPKAIAKFVSDRHFGIGADGLILIKPSKCAAIKMEMYNADGSEGEMCGNGIRCVAKYAFDYGIVNEKDITVETKAGIKQLDLVLKQGKVDTVTVDMGEAITKPDLIPVLAQEEVVIKKPIEILGKMYSITCVSMGNPHAITFVEDTASIAIEKIGPQFEHHAWFPKRINTEFIQVIDRNTINMRVWERGSGETLACGTGACASVYACILNGETEDEVLVHLLGGDLRIRYDRDTNHIFLTGPAVTVFDGDIDCNGLFLKTGEQA
ncbi:MAG: diaminopimelate epimerase [Velocimicrobium sp.]